MSELDARIGPRKSPLSEPKPVYQHKSWVRPGYNPPSPSKKPRDVHNLGPSPSRSDGGPALLSRMDLTDFPYSPNPKPMKHRNRKRHRVGRSLGNLEDSNGLILGNHRVAKSTVDEVITARSPSPMSSVTEHEVMLNSHTYSQVDDPDLIPGLHLRALHDATAPAPPGSGHGPKFDMVTSSESLPSEGERFRGLGDPANSWSRPSLMERIAPLVRHNAHLRYARDRQGEHNDRASSLIHDKSVDAVMTSIFCDNLTASLITCQSQLAQEQRSSKVPIAKNAFNTEPHFENSPPPATSKAGSSSSHSFAGGSPTPKEFTTTSHRLSQEPSIDTALATDQSTTLIPLPIPIPSAIVSPQSSTSTGFATPSNMAREKHSSNTQKRSRSPNPYTQSYTRPRSRSPPPHWRSQEYERNSRVRSPRSPPLPYHRLPPSPHVSRHPSYTYTSHRSKSPHRSRSPHASPYTHPLRSPYESRRSRSPRSYRSNSPPTHTWESPRRREANTAEIPRSMSETFRGQRQPAVAEKYSGGSSKKRYLTAFEREELEKAKGDEDRGRAENTARNSSQAMETRQTQNGLFTDQMGVDKRTTLSPAPATVMTSARYRSPSAHALSSAEGDSIKPCQTGQKQYSRANSPEDGTGSGAKSDSETRNLASAGATLKPGFQIKELPPWRPFGGLPGIWLLMNGSATPEVSEHSFEISKEVATEWNIPRVSIDGEPLMGTKLGIAQQPSRLSWKLKCVLVESVDPVRQRLEESGTAENLVQELDRFESYWPLGGNLIVEVNPSYTSGQTFYAKQLDSGVPFVELNYHIHEGTNFIRFIQLGDLSKHVFILYATNCTSFPQTDQHILDLDNLRNTLQKSRRDDLPESSHQSLFGAHTAHVSVTVNNNF